VKTLIKIIAAILIFIVALKFSHVFVGLLLVSIAAYIAYNQSGP